MQTRGIWRSAGPHKPSLAGSIPAPATRAGGVIGSAAPLQGEGCGFESRAVHAQPPLDEAQLAARRRRKPEVGSSNLSVQTDTHPGPTHKGRARWWNGNHTWL